MTLKTHYNGVKIANIKASKEQFKEECRRAKLQPSVLQDWTQPLNSWPSNYNYQKINVLLMIFSKRCRQ